MADGRNMSAQTSGQTRADFPSASSNENRQTSRVSSSPEEARTPNSQTTANNLPHCTSPESVFSIATSLAVLFASKLNQDELQTLINLLTLLIAGISSIVTQQQICEGIIVQQTS